MKVTTHHLAVSWKEKVMKLDKDQKAMDQADLTAEPSLDKMMDLTDPKVLSGLGKLAKILQEREKAKPVTFKRYAEHLLGESFSEDD